MSEKEALVSHVEEFPNFPFTDFRQLRVALASGFAHLAVDRRLALTWAQGGPYASSRVRYITTLTTWLPMLSALGFIIWVIVSKSWLMLFALPLWIIGYVVYHPGIGSFFGPIRTLLIGLTFFGFVYGLLTSRPRMAALCAGLVLIWYGIRVTYSLSVGNLIRAASSHEDLFCALWQDEKMSIEMKNGDRYLKTYKVMNGEFVHYA